MPHVLSGQLADLLADCPIIAAAKSEEGLQAALSSDCRIIFLLFGSICSIGGLTEQVSASGKRVFVHADLIDGLANRDISADFLAGSTAADGLISTKPSLIRRAHALGLCTVQRFFVIDSMALENLQRQLPQTRPDIVEILPGVMPKVLRRITAFTPVPVIAGGLIADKEDILTALDAGAAAISSTDRAVWFL